MSAEDLYELVLNAKRGDKDSMNRIVELFKPLIFKASRRSNPQVQRDLEQHLTGGLCLRYRTYSGLHRILRMDKGTRLPFFIKCYVVQVKGRPNGKY